MAALAPHTSLRPRITPMQTVSEVRPKRARSNSSSSSSSSSAASSYNEGSIFLREHSNSSSQSSVDSGSSSCCSSPYTSNPSSPSSRPAKACRLQAECDSDEESRARQRDACFKQECSVTQESLPSALCLEKITAAAASLASVESVLSSTSSQQSSSTTLQASSSSTSLSSQSSKSNLPSPTSQSGVGRTVFVDCLVDATVHCLDMIWHAPIHKSIAFLSSALDATSTRVFIDDEDIKRPCNCPVGAPLTGGLPLDVFIRETLRRSRTSCSTLQAALLYCKRIGGEVVRKRAEVEGIALSAKDKACLVEIAKPLNKQGMAPTRFASLPDGLDASISDSSDPTSQQVDPLLCSRRTFLAAVVISSKFLQDRTYSNRAWSKISGLPVRELCGVERRVLDALAFDLAATDDEWALWVRYLSGTWKASLDTCHCRAQPQTATDTAAVHSMASL